MCSLTNPHDSVTILTLVLECVAVKLAVRSLTATTCVVMVVFKGKSKYQITPSYLTLNP